MLLFIFIIKFHIYREIFEKQVNSCTHGPQNSSLHVLRWQYIPRRSRIPQDGNMPNVVNTTWNKLRNFKFPRKLKVSEKNWSFRANFKFLGKLEVSEKTWSFQDVVAHWSDMWCLLVSAPDSGAEVPGSNPASPAMILMRFRIIVTK